MMNFLDTYDVTGPSVVSESQNQTQQSLNEEVSDVIGNIGRFWGGFRKQSQTVIETARKDFSGVVTQAQKELIKLTTDGEASAATERREPMVDDGPTSTNESDELTPEITPAGSVNVQLDTPIASTSTQTLFSRLQSALPPNVVATVNSHIPESLKHASENMDLTQLRTTFMSEFQRVQGVTRTQAEGYVHKSESLLREAVKEAGEVLRDAVKIIPPDSSHESRLSSLVWDGTDMWSLPSEPLDQSTSDKGQSGNGKSQQGSVDAHLAVATRAESLFRRLKQDPSIIRHDPEADPSLKELYTQWLSSEVNPKEGGIDSDEWSTKISTLLAEPSTGEALKATRDTLVPSELSLATFWTRFLFRAHQIEVEEEKRKALIEGSLEEEDFSWEDDEDDAIPPSAMSAPLNTSNSNTAPGHVVADVDNVIPDARNPPSTSTLTLNIGARESSEESFDVVSSGNASPMKRTKSEQTKVDSDDPDSDWE